MKSINKILLLFAIIMVIAITAGIAQIKNAKSETVKVYGNCDMCKATIEKAGNTKNVAKIDWNKDTKTATIAYDPTRTNKDAILKRIALAGYDSDSFLAPDAAYNSLPDCCKYDRMSKTNSPSSLAEIGATDRDLAEAKVTDMSKMETMPAAARATNILQPVYDAYFSLKDALVKTDAAIASAKAKDLQTAINAVKMEDLGMDVHMVWMKILNNLKADAQSINSTKDVGKQRNHFTTLSKNIYALIKISKPAETIYYDHCPMYNNGKGADWLSKESEIKNPYYGTMMLGCGETTETIK